MVVHYRQTNGRLPASLEELRKLTGFPTPSEPYTGKDLAYRIQPTGFAAYSIGEDLIDEGGPPAPGDDLGVVVRFPSATSATSQPEAAASQSDTGR